MLLAGSHLVIATDRVPEMASFFSELFDLTAHFSNDQFCEFVLPSRFRIAFFKPVGASAKYFRSSGERHHASFGVTTDDVEAIYRRADSPRFREKGVATSGPPKEHPWGEKSFLLIDPDGNRWEVTEAPSPEGMLVNREE